MAMKNFVPAPGAKFGMIPFVQAGLPEYFEDVTELTVRKYVLKGSRRYDLLAPNGFNPETCQRLRVRLDGRRHWVPVWVNARGQNAAVQILREHLPPRSYSVARLPL
jgi:hypothetical protein